MRWETLGVRSKLRAFLHSGDLRHHYISGDLVADIEGTTVRLSANGNVAVMFERLE